MGKMKGTKGRLHITPRAPFKEFDYPAEPDKEDWFCRVTYDGETYFYTGKTQESAAHSYHSSIVTVLSEHEELYEV